jgi:hypothetical protein
MQVTILSSLLHQDLSYCFRSAVYDFHFPGRHVEFAMLPFLDSVATSRAGMLLSMLPPPTKPDLFLEEVQNGEMAWGRENRLNLNLMQSHPI